MNLLCTTCEGGDTVVYITWTDFFGFLEVFVAVVGLIVFIYDQNNKKN